MANLLSEADLADFLAATQDTTDTFMRQPVTFLRPVATIRKFNDTTGTDTRNEVTVNGLFVLGQDKLETGASGAVDLGDGYALFNRTDLADVDLADALGSLSIVAGEDRLRVAGVEYAITTVTPLGPLAGVYTLGKIIVKKLLQDHA